MKKIRLHVAFICVLAGMSYCALAEEKTATPSSAAVSAEAPNNVIGVVETAKEGKADVKVAELQIIKEKASLEQEKIELIKNAEKEHSKSNGGGSAENLVIQQKLEVLEKKEAVVAAKENVVTEKIEAYERAAAIIERKLEILNSKDLSLDDIEREYERVNRLLADAKAEKAFLKGKLPLIEMETKAIEKELQTQNILLGLKGDKDNAVSDIIKTRNEHLTVTAKEGELIRERISFVDVQVELIKDYIAALNEKRIEVFRYELLTPRPLSAGMTEGAALLFFAGLLLAVMFYRPRIREAVLKSGASLAGKLMCKTLTLFLYSGIGLFAGYFIISFLGYHKLAMYVGVRVLLAVVVVAVLAVFHRVMKRVLHRGEEGDEKHTLMDGIATILGWAMVFFGVFIVTKIAGFEREAMFFLKRAAERPFFVMGEVNISAGIIFKFAFIVWLFILASRFLDAFLKSNIYKRMRLDESVQYALSVAIKYLMMVLGLFIGISALGVDLAALTVFAGTVGIGIGFGLQEIAKNFIAGMVLLVERPIKVGDYIEVGGLPGRVRLIKARGTIVDTFDNISVVVPNSEFMTQQIINWSYSDKLTRVKIPVGVAYGSDTELVKKCLMEVAEQHPKVLKKPDPYVWFEAFGDSSLNFTLFVWTNEPQNRMSLKSELNFKIDAIFRENKITIPFPQRDLHFKSSDISFGGQKPGGEQVIA